jgi:hypothetical protein
MRISAKSMFVLIAAASVALASPASAIDQTHKKNQKVERVHTHTGERTAPLSPREPFTAAEKRAFQTPTGKEIDRW